MVIVCPSCHGKFRTKELDAGRTYRVNCPKCANTFTVQPSPSETQQTSAMADPPRSATPSPPIATAPSPPTETSPAAVETATAGDSRQAEAQTEQWQVGRDGEQLGNFTTETLVAAVAEGKMPRDVLVWRSGMATWTLLSDVPTLAAAVRDAIENRDRDRLAEEQRMPVDLPPPQTVGRLPRPAPVDAVRPVAVDEPAGSPVIARAKPAAWVARHPIAIVGLAAIGLGLIIVRYGLADRAGGHPVAKAGAVGREVARPDSLPSIAPTTTVTSGPSVVPPKCAEDCVSFGRCTLNAKGECTPGTDDQCQRSTACGKSGECRLVRELDTATGIEVTSCQPASDDDCKNSLDCKAGGLCKLQGVFGTFRNCGKQVADPDTIRSIRTMLWASAQDGNAYKRETLNILTAKSGNDFGKTIWTKLDENLWLFAAESRETIVKQRKNASPTSSSAWALLDDSTADLGEACVSALRADGVRAQQEFDDAAFHDTDWMMKAGGAACGPASTPAISKCGKAEAPEKARSKAGWNQYSCQFQQDVGAGWGQCLPNKELSREANEGCPGRMRCCPTPTAKPKLESVASEAVANPLDSQGRPNKVAGSVLDQLVKAADSCEKLKAATRAWAKGQAPADMKAEELMMMVWALTGMSPDQIKPQYKKLSDMNVVKLSRAGRGQFNDAVKEALILTIDVPADCRKQISETALKVIADCKAVEAVSTGWIKSSAPACGIR